MQALSLYSPCLVMTDSIFRGQDHCQAAQARSLKPGLGKANHYLPESTNRLADSLAVDTGHCSACHAAGIDVIDIGLNGK